MKEAFTEKNISAIDKEKDDRKVDPMPERLRKHKKILIITADEVEDLEFFYHYHHFDEEGDQIIV